MVRTPLIAAVVAVAFPGVALAQLQVVTHSPGLNAVAAVGETISVEFDQPLNTATVTAATFRAYGQWSGPATGAYSFSNGNKTVKLTPSDPFSAGETVFVNLSHDIQSSGAVPLRAAGYAFQFVTATVTSTATFKEITRFSNRTGPNTRIYGAAAADLNNDEYLDLATVNEDSHDIRVFLNLADGTGLFAPMLPREAIGVEASPNAPADFNNDGNVDLCVSAADSADVWIMLGAGDGTFTSVGISVGGEPHGIAPLDVDGDGDLDIVNANVGSNELALLINNGAGVFGAPTYFEGGVDGEYGLTAADMNADGITDLVVGGRNGEEINTMLGNGDGTFTAAGLPQSSGGLTWVVVLGDLDGDGDLDVAAANNGTGNIGILKNQGNGTFAPPTTVPIGFHVPSVDLGDLDGDDDPDLVASSFGGGFWTWYRNDGTGAFSEVVSFPAPSNPSCAVLFDVDNDGDLDMALSDEIDDMMVLMENGGVSSCSTTPKTCRNNTLAKRSKLVLRDKFPDTKDILFWTWRRGEATTKMEFGSPLTTDDYALCLYEDDVLKDGFAVPAGLGWKEIKKGYRYRDKYLTHDGIARTRLVSGITGSAKITLKGKGVRLEMPDLTQLNGVLKVQMQKANDTLCWGAIYTPPFRKQTPLLLVAYSDPPPPSMPPLNPIWSEIHPQVIAPNCTGCHGPFAGLTGLGDCNTAYAALVNAASTELPSMDRVAPGNSLSSYVMHKLDGTQSMFNAMCGGGNCGSQMPLGGPFLSQEIRDVIRTWITDGAVNDCP